jgi:hypothetical protein
MELSDSALETMKKDLDDLVKRASEREIKAARLQGQHEIVIRILEPLGLAQLVTVELARIKREIDVLLKEKEEANLQLDTISAMLSEHRKSKESKEQHTDGDHTKPEDKLDEGTGTSSENQH